MYVAKPSTFKETRVQENDSAFTARDARVVKPDARAPFYGSFSYLFLVGSFSVSEDFFSHLGLSHSVVSRVSWCRSTAPFVLYPNLPFFSHL